MLINIYLDFSVLITLKVKKQENETILCLSFGKQKTGALYIGITNNLISRVCKHKDNSLSKFTKNRGIHNLVWFEEYDNIRKAIAREKQLKKWKRQWKVRLIEESNPQWRDLYPDLIH